jgi:MYXO-CTERM domain-containing protein
VTNLIVDPNTVGQNVSGLFFTLSGISSLSLASQIAPTTVNVASDGTYSTAGTNVNPGWGFQSTSPYGVNALSGAVSTPSLTILGAPGAGNVYCNKQGCGSIAGNGPHNPFIFEAATFVFDFTPIAGQSLALGNVQMNFGTANGGDLNRLTCTVDCGTTPPQSVPEPGTLALGAVGLLVLGFARRRRVH